MLIAGEASGEVSLAAPHQAERPPCLPRASSLPRAREPRDLRHFPGRFLFASALTIYSVMMKASALRAPTGKRQRTPGAVRRP